MAANNYYLGLTMGADNNYENVVTSASANAGPGGGTGADVELRIQTDAGAGPNGITRKLVIEKLQILMEFINGGGSGPGAGVNLPAL
jgi:hypothetical protein